MWYHQLYRGDCTQGRESACIHAAVIMIDGILWCSLELDQGYVNTSDEVPPTAPTSEHNQQQDSNSTHQCNLVSSYSEAVNHRFLYDKQTGRQVLSPPLEPPWQNCSVFSFNNVNSSTTSTATDSVDTTYEGNIPVSSGRVSEDPERVTTARNNSSRQYTQTHSLFCLISIVCCLVLSKVHL